MVRLQYRQMQDGSFIVQGENGQATRMSRAEFETFLKQNNGQNYSQEGRPSRVAQAGRALRTVQRGLASAGRRAAPPIRRGARRAGRYAKEFTKEELRLQKKMIVDRARSMQRGAAARRARPRRVRRRPRRRARKREAFRWF